MADNKRNHQFQITLPAGWQDQTVNYFLGPLDSGVQHSITMLIDRTPNTDDIVEYARPRIDQVMRTMTSVEKLKEAPNTLESGLETYDVVYKLTCTEGKPTFRKQVFVMDGDTAYMFCGDFSKKTIKTIGVEMDQIIASLEPGEVS